eukprot:scaffold2041_cov110-Isochrysis_galbana.AAC.5
MTLLSEPHRAPPFSLQVITEAAPPYRVLSVSPGWERLCGYSGAEAAGRTLHFLQGPETPRAPIEALMSAVRQSRPALVRLTNYTKTGAPFGDGPRLPGNLAAAPQARGAPQSRRRTRASPHQPRAAAALVASVSTRLAPRLGSGRCGAGSHTSARRTRRWARRTRHGDYDVAGERPPGRSDGRDEPGLADGRNRQLELVTAGAGWGGGWRGRSTAVAGRPAGRSGGEWHEQPTAKRSAHGGTCDRQHDTHQLLFTVPSSAGVNGCGWRTAGRRRG